VVFLIQASIESGLDVRRRAAIRLAVRDAAARTTAGDERDVPGVAVDTREQLAVMAQDVKSLARLALGQMREWTWAWGRRIGYSDPRCSHPSETDASGRVGQALEFNWHFFL
jgi:hypothetical protein